MLHWLTSLDQVLRGETTSPEAIRDGNIQLPLRGMCFVGVLLAMIYGACMGSFSLFHTADSSVRGGADRYLQVLATTMKVPALFFLTLTITFPSLYVFNALVGSRLTLQPLLRLLVASLGVNLAVLASLGPIVAFFSVSTTNYHFMLLFNVLVFAVAGTLGLLFLSQTLHRISVSMQKTDSSESPDTIISNPEQLAAAVKQDLADADGHREESSKASALDTITGNVLGRHVTLVFRCWIIVFGLVGAQMGWVLRPFLGHPELPFALFRGRESNFFEAVLVAIRALMLG